MVLHYYIKGKIHAMVNFQQNQRNQRNIPIGWKYKK